MSIHTRTLLCKALFAVGHIQGTANAQIVVGFILKSEVHRRSHLPKISADTSLQAIYGRPEAAAGDLSLQNK